MSKKSVFRKWYFWVLVILLVVALGAAVIEVVQPGTLETSIGSLISKPIENEILTAENFESLTSQYAEEHKEETYYLSYSMLNAAFTDGLSQAITDAFENKTSDSSMAYKSLFGKTIRELIEEGKKLMKDNNITLEQYKEQLNSLNNLGEE